MTDYYTRVISAVDRGQASEIYRAVRECQDERDQLRATVMDLMVWVRKWRRNLVEGDYEWQIDQMDRVLEQHKGFLVEEAE